LLRGPLGRAAVSARHRVVVRGTRNELIIFVLFYVSHYRSGPRKQPVWRPVGLSPSALDAVGGRDILARTPGLGGQNSPDARGSTSRNIMAVYQ
jgi:hypothetical protein